MTRLPIALSCLLISLMGLASSTTASARHSNARDGLYRRLTHAQSTATLQGRVVDPNRAVVRNASITARNLETGVERVGESDEQGNYQIAALPVGGYRVEVRAGGFRIEVVEGLRVEVGRIIVRDFQLEIGDITQAVNVTTDAPLVEQATVSVGQVINERTVQEIPLNGRYFIDLGLLIPGSVTPPQNGLLSPPTRGGGSLAFNTAGNREDTVNFQINGITLNDQVNNILNFNPPLTSIREFKIDNSTFSAEYGRNSGAIVNVATRSGTQEFHGELYEFFRNDALDARNFFNFTSRNPPPFKRNQFGGALGGPIKLPRFGEGGPAFTSGKRRAFFFFNYEALRQRQGVDLNSLVLSDAQRASVTDPVIRRLIELIPRANFFDAAGTPRFVGSAPASADVNQWTIDMLQSQRTRPAARLLRLPARPAHGAEPTGEHYPRLRRHPQGVATNPDAERNAHLQSCRRQRSASGLQPHLFHSDGGR